MWHASQRRLNDDALAHNNWTMMKSKRVFGGAQGVWLRKKTTSEEVRKRPYIEWDHERCRPVYEDTSTQDEESPVDESEDDNEQPVTASPNLAWLNNTRKKGSFATKKRTYVLSPMPPSMIKRPRVSHSPTAAAPVALLDAPAQTPLPTQDSPPIISQPQPAVSASPKDDLDFDPAAHEQQQQATPKPAAAPTSTTSLSAARRFFHQLDTNHPLQLDSTKEESPHWLPGRSSRAVMVHDHDVRAAYQAHVENCEANDLAYLTLESFVEQRAHFEPALYNGFLDD